MEHKFVFIGGSHRSGTSILFKCLKEHPLISGFQDTGVPEDEGQHLQSIYRPAKDFGGATQYGYHPGSHLTENSELITDGNRQKLLAEWQQHWDMNKPVLLEKSPPNLTKARFLQEMFEKTYFIIIMRHPVATLYPRHESRAKIKISSRINHWLTCHEIFARDSAGIKNLFVMKYENFVKAPARYLEQIYSFVGIHNHDNNLDIHPDINSKYFDRWRKTEKQFGAGMVLNFTKRRLEKKVNDFGYSLYDLSQVDSKFEDSLGAAQLTKQVS